MKLGNEVVAGTLMVLAAQAALVVAKLVGWLPVAVFGWWTLAWFPWAFAASSILLSVVLLLLGIAFDRGPRKLEAWLERRANAGR